MNPSRLHSSNHDSRRYGRPNYVLRPGQAFLNPNAAYDNAPVIGQRQDRIE
jgi:hypothetical protein